ncbi:Uncharacterized protein PECH_000688 [Penicillium ucsense]|uniref:Phosphatidylinositol-specific phospholipase C X domain-containing protein n=1 Tax=Penicillium ucsense TaxID=2839758 RepID=A0A8J8W6Z4_9EURO|nr:Uncharacterized protein PECM_004961 [Penicillium ucsense]KAF7738413.1 Uncharacterized protein PECH_000688 [Penicillium ucsense]
MVAEKLTVRNSTSTPIILRCIERFESPQDSNAGDNIALFARNFTRVLTNTTRIAEPVKAISEATRPFEEQNDLEVRIDPFTTNQTDWRAFVHSDKERMRLTFEVEGERHIIQVPVPTAESATMKCESENPKHRLTGVYLTNESHLAIFSSANLNAWMHELRDDIRLPALSIPGTHNSPTCYVAPPSVRCQAVGPKEQLQNGVRFFDIRVQPQCPEDLDKDDLILVHSVFPISLTGNKYFRDLMKEVNEFLDQNPSETVIMSLKREGPGNATDEQLAEILSRHYIRPDSRWWTTPWPPTLGQVRGKVVLVRRFSIPDELKKQHDTFGWGIDGCGWEDNHPNANCPSGHLCIQDFYEVQESTNIDTKINYVRQHLDRASRHSHPFGEIPNPDRGRECPFYINFLSASNFWRPNTWPEKIAAKVNPATVDYLCRRPYHENGDSSTGILVTDWVGLDGDWDLVRCTVGMNAKLRLREN